MGIENNKTSTSKALNLSLVLFFILIAFGACSPKLKLATPLGPDVWENDVYYLRDIVSKKTGCPVEKLSYRYTEGDYHSMEGCGQNEFYAYMCSGHCGWVSINNLKKRAEFDLNCETELTVRKVADMTWGVEGCGSRAAYVGVHKGWGEFIWLLNSESKSN